MNLYIKHRVLTEAHFYDLMLESYIPINIWTIKILGTEAAIMLAKLFEEYNYKKSVNKIIDNMFECSINKIKNDIGLSRSKQVKAIEKLSNLNIINKTVTTGLKKKRYFSFNFDSVYMLRQQINELKEKSKLEYADRIKANQEITKKLEDWKRRSDQSMGTTQIEPIITQCETNNATSCDIPF